MSKVICEKLKAYRKMHLSIYAVFIGFLLYIGHILHGFWREIMRKRIIERLTKKYKKNIIPIKRALEEEDKNLEHISNNTIWLCWVQGLDAAPNVVKACYKSVQQHMGDAFEIKLITEDNYHEYVSFPDFILEKYRKGIISKTLFSDLLRLQLLIQYGGIWMDATLYCTQKIPSYISNSDLFLFQVTPPDLATQATRIQSWFMVAKSNNLLLRAVQEMLYQYLNDYDRVVDYFIMFDFFEILIPFYTDEWKKVPTESHGNCNILQEIMFEKYDQEYWDYLSRISFVHKITYKLEETYMRPLEDLLNEEDTYYQTLILGGEHDETFPSGYTVG